jgi:hypothetical protein
MFNVLPDSVAAPLEPTLVTLSGLVVGACHCSRERAAGALQQSGNRGLERQRRRGGGVGDAAGKTVGVDDRDIGDGADPAAAGRGQPDDLHHLDIERDRGGKGDRGGR